MNKNINDMYYTPGISDIRIGYECEILERKYIHNGNHYVLDEESVKEDKWKKIIIDDNVHSDNKISRIAHFFIESSSEIKIRTSFLTKEQIESEGWVYVKEIDKYKHPFYTSVEIYLNTTGYIPYLFITIPTVGYNGEGRTNIFSGQCPSINEFRYICKLLKIC